MWNRFIVPYPCYSNIILNNNLGRLLYRADVNRPWQSDQLDEKCGAVTIVQVVENMTRIRDAHDRWRRLRRTYKRRSDTFRTHLVLRVVPLTAAWARRLAMSIADTYDSIRATSIPNVGSNDSLNQKSDCNTYCKTIFCSIFSFS